MEFGLETPVGQLIQGSAQRTRILEKYGIDFGRGAKISLDTACTKRGLDPAMVLQELAGSDLPPRPMAGLNLARLSQHDLIAHVLETHHRYLWAELPRLQQLADEVARVHGPNHPELLELGDLFQRFSEEMVAHMRKEEEVLFPFCRAMEARPTSLGMPAVLVRRPIGVMEIEHEAAVDDLARMRTLTSGFTPPPDACDSYRALFSGLAALEADTLRHMDTEDAIVFPSAVALADPLVDIP